MLNPKSVLIPKPYFCKPYFEYAQLTVVRRLDECVQGIVRVLSVGVCMCRVFFLNPSSLQIPKP